MNSTYREHLMSALWSFLTGFLLIIIPAIDTIDVNHLDKAMIVGLLFAAARAGIKAVGQLMLTWNNPQ